MRRASGDLGQPDDRLDGLHLAEERRGAGELMVAPMLQKPLRSPVTPQSAGFCSARHRST